MRESRHGLTLSGRGWYRRVGGRWRWVCSALAAPTAEQADAIFEERFAELARAPVPVASASVEDLADAWLDHHEQRVASGALERATYLAYRYTIGGFVLSVGAGTMVANLTPAHFEGFIRDIGNGTPARRLLCVNCVRLMFRWAVGMGYCHPPEYGPAFRPPSRVEFRRRKAAVSTMRFYATEELAALLRHATPMMRAAILLGLNGGLGNHDVAALTWAQVDLRAGWIAYPRPKTGIDRQIPLWAETVSALQALPRTVGVVFQTQRADAGDRNFVGKKFAELCKSAGVTNKGFYSLRRTFRTIADAHGDQRAAAVIMGHEVGDMGGVYVQHVTPERLRAVADYVRGVVRDAVAPAAGTSPGDAGAEPRPSRPKPTKRRGRRD